MSDFLQFLSENPDTAMAITVAVSVIFISIALMFVFAFFQGREVTFWPPKIGSKPLPKTNHEKQ